MKTGASPLTTAFVAGRDTADVSAAATASEAGTSQRIVL